MFWASSDLSLRPLIEEGLIARAARGDVIRAHFMSNETFKFNQRALLMRREFPPHFIRWEIRILTGELRRNWRPPLFEMAFKDAIKLYKVLMDESNYNNRIRPVDSNSDTLTVYLGLRLSQLSEVNMRKETVTTNVWLEQQWIDVNLQWDPNLYGGVTKLYIPSHRLWLPDIVLFNNIDGKYEISIKTKATVFHDGVVKWIPPAIYKSSCQINVEFFPYDIQECFLTFASWTYEGSKVNLKHMSQKNVNDVPNATGMVNIDYAMDLRNFYDSVEFDILELSAERTSISYMQPFPKVNFKIIMRRKTLFYTVNLMMPCLAICFLSMLAFYLPSESGEKVYLSITILFSLTLFFLLLVETIPSTSLVIPLIGKYLLFTMILISLSIILTVYVLNVHFRSSLSHEMPDWVKRIFLGTLPKLLLIDRPTKMVPLKPCKRFSKNISKPEISKISRPCTSNKSSYSYASRFMPADASNYTFTSHLTTQDSITQLSTELRRKIYKSSKPNSKSKMKLDSDSDLDLKIDKAVAEIEYVANHLRDDYDSNDIKQDWKFIAMVMDRLFLWTFSSACLMSTLCIILQSPALYDTRKPINSLNVPNCTNLYYQLRSGVHRVKIDY